MGALPLHVRAANHDDYSGPIERQRDLRNRGSLALAFLADLVSIFSPCVLTHASNNRAAKSTGNAVDVRMLSAACRADESIPCGRAKSCGPDALTLASTPGS